MGPQEHWPSLWRWQEDDSTQWDMNLFFLFLNALFLKMDSVGTLFNHKNPELQHHQGTLREFHEITTTLSNEDCPPLNIISLPVHQRNLYVPCQFGSMASHEVAQSHVPSEYETMFDVCGVKSLMEWCLVGSRSAISPFHVDWGLWWSFLKEAKIGS